MRCIQHSKRECDICFPMKASPLSAQDDSFVMGLLTGIATSSTGLIGAAIHDSLRDSSSNSSDCSNTDSGNCDY